MRLIDGDALQEKLTKKKPEPANARYTEGFNDALLRFKSMIHTAPTIEPERQKGEWIDYAEDGYVECPFCHSATNCDGNKDELHFCFSRGADMRGEQDDR